MGRGGDDDDMGDKLVATPDFDGPTGKRHCTDILCSIFLDEFQSKMFMSMTFLWSGGMVEVLVIVWISFHAGRMVATYRRLVTTRQIKGTIDTTFAVDKYH